MPNVKVIDERGAWLGEMPHRRALKLARERGLDLVEVAPDARPPVVRLVDLAAFKKEQAEKVAARTAEVRAVRRSLFVERHQRLPYDLPLRVRMSKRDFSKAVTRARRTIELGCKVSFSIRVAADGSRALLDQAVEQLGDIADVDRKPCVKGHFLRVALCPRIPPPAPSEGP